MIEYRYSYSVNTYHKESSGESIVMFLQKVS